MAATVHVNGSPTSDVFVPLNSTVSLTNGTLAGVTSQTWECLGYPEYEDLTQVDHATNFSGWTLAAGKLTLAQVGAFPAITFKPDIPGTYLIRLSATTGAGTERQTCCIRVRGALSGDAEPAAGENVESGAARGTGGWGRFANRWIRNGEIRKGRIRVYNGTGVTIAANKAGKLSGLVDFRTVAGNTVPSGSATRPEKVPSIVVGNSNDADALTAKYVQLVESIANDAFGWGVAWGVFEGNFSAFADGANVYLNTSGDLVTAPAGANTVILGHVLDNGSAGGIFFSGLGGSGGGGVAGAPATPQFMTLAADAGLTNERVFTPGAGLSAVDGGAGNAYTLSIATAGVTRAMLANGAATSVVGRAAGSSGAVADIAATADGQFLKRTGGALAWAAILDTELPSTLMRTSWTLTAGSGLAGGGDGSANRSISIATSGVTSAMLRDSIACSVIGRATNSTGVVADIQAAATGQYLSRQGTSLVFAAILDVDLPGTVVRTTRQVIAGTGLAGGGALSSDPTISMPNVGPGASGYGGGGIASITLDAQGRVTALTTATYGTSTTVIAAGRIAWATSTNVVGGSANLTWDDTLKLMTFLNGRISGLTATFSSYTSDGLFNANARHALIWGTPNGGVAGRLGYDDGGGGQYQPAIGLDVSGAGRAAIRFRVVGEANDKFTVINDGMLQWGPGGATAVDTTFGRSAAGTLTQSQGTTSLAYAAGTGAIVHNYNGEVQPRWQIHRDAAGGGLAGIMFGPGGASTIAAAGAGVGSAGSTTLGLYASDGAALAEVARAYVATGRYRIGFTQFNSQITFGSGATGTPGNYNSYKIIAWDDVGFPGSSYGLGVGSNFIWLNGAGGSKFYTSGNEDARFNAGVLSIVTSSGAGVVSMGSLRYNSSKLQYNQNNTGWKSFDDFVLGTSVSIIAGTGLAGGGDLTVSRTISMPNVGPGASGYGGSGISSVTLDAQGRVTALSTASYLSTAALSIAANQIAYGTGSNVIGGSADAQWNNSSKVATFASGTTSVGINAGNGSLSHTFSGEANPRYILSRDQAGAGLAGLAFGVGGASTIAATGAAVGLFAIGSIGMLVSNGTTLTSVFRVDTTAGRYRMLFSQNTSQINFGNGTVGAPSSYDNYKIVAYDGGSPSGSYGMGVEGSNLWLHSAVGIKLYSAATNYATMDNAGKWCFGGSTTPRYIVDITGSAASQLRWGSGTADSGGFLTSTNGEQAFIGAGNAFDPGAGSWRAKAANTWLFGGESGTVSLYLNVGVTPGSLMSHTSHVHFDIGGGRRRMVFPQATSQITFGAGTNGGPSSLDNWKIITYDSGTPSGSYGLGIEGQFSWLHAGSATGGVKFYANLTEISRFEISSSRYRLTFPQTVSQVSFSAGANGGPSTFDNFKVILYEGVSSTGSYGIGLESHYTWLNSGSAIGGAKFYAGGTELARFEASAQPRLYFARTNSSVSFGFSTKGSPSDLNAWRAILYDTGVASSSYGIGVGSDYIFYSVPSSASHVFTVNLVTRVSINPNEVFLLGPLTMDTGGNSWGGGAGNSIINMGPCSSEPSGFITSNRIVQYNSNGRIAYRDTDGNLFQGWGF